MENAAISGEPETFQRPAGQELRIELDHTTQVAVTGRAGEAEVFGTPLVVGGRTVLWGPQKTAVYTPSGATVEVKVRARRRVWVSGVWCLADVFVVVFPRTQSRVARNASLARWCLTRASVRLSVAGIARGHVYRGGDADGAVH